MIRVSAIAASLAASLVVTAAAAPQADPLSRQSWTVGGVTRTALVASPTAPVPSDGSPLVFIFHGHGGTAQHSARTFAIHTRWPEAVVVYAQGLPTAGLMTDPSGQKPGWQHAPGAEGDRDLKYVDAMLAWVRSRYRIAPGRIYAAGHSNGGTMTYVLWVARPDVFAAFAPSASVFRRDLMPKAKPKPALIIVGEKDQLVPPAAQHASLGQTLRLNQAAPTGVPWSGRYATLHTSPIGADVVAYIHPGDHTMPGNAGEMMVKFFKSR